MFHKNKIVEVVFMYKFMYKFMYAVIDVELDSRFMPTKITLVDLATEEKRTVTFGQLLMYKDKFDVAEFKRHVAIRKMCMCIKQDLSTKGIAFTQGYLEGKVDLQSFLPYTASQCKDDFFLNDAIIFKEVLSKSLGEKYLIVVQPFCREYDDCFIGVCENNAQNAVVMFKEYLKMQLTVVSHHRKLEMDPIEKIFDALVAILETSYKTSNFAIKQGDVTVIRRRSNQYSFAYVFCLVDMEHYKKIECISEEYQLLGISKVYEDYGPLIEDDEICSLIMAIERETGNLY